MATAATLPIMRTLLMSSSLSRRPKTTAEASDECCAVAAPKRPVVQAIIIVQPAGDDGQWDAVPVDVDDEAATILVHVLSPQLHSDGPP